MPVNVFASNCQNIHKQAVLHQYYSRALFSTERSEGAPVKFVSAPSNCDIGNFKAFHNTISMSTNRISDVTLLDTCQMNCQSHFKRSKTINVYDFDYFSNLVEDM